MGLAGQAVACCVMIQKESSRLNSFENGEATDDGDDYFCFQKPNGWRLGLDLFKTKFCILLPPFL